MTAADKQGGSPGRLQRLRGAFEEALAPIHLELEDESGNHSVPAGAESHFRALIVSEHFAGLSRVQRHRAVWRLIGAELNSGLHALALQTLAPAEWQPDTEARQSPDCLGGSDS